MNIFEKASTFKAGESWGSFDLSNHFDSIPKISDKQKLLRILTQNKWTTANLLVCVCKKHKNNNVFLKNVHDKSIVHFSNKLLSEVIFGEKIQIESNNENEKNAKHSIKFVENETDYVLEMPIKVSILALSNKLVEKMNSIFTIKVDNDVVMDEEEEEGEDEGIGKIQNDFIKRVVLLSKEDDNFFECICLCITKLNNDNLCSLLFEKVIKNEKHERILKVHPYVCTQLSDLYFTFYKHYVNTLRNNFSQKEPHKHVRIQYLLAKNSKLKNITNTLLNTIQ